jgi:RNA 3'-terminal phosphate cyclase (ATP)
MIELDGSAGGGQLLRTALTLSLCTATPFRMRGIRAGRARPGLMRQHLTAVEAAARIGNAHVEGAMPGSQELVFVPGAVQGGDFRFAIGTAGSTTLVAQTVLPVLLRADRISTVKLEGGTHNPMAPPADFLAQAFVPQLARMGANARVDVSRHGFFPAGGGRLELRVEPCAALAPLELTARGDVRRVRATALVSGLPADIGRRELEVAARRLGVKRDGQSLVDVTPALGPGNVFLVAVEAEHVTEVFVGFGERGISAETVADRVCREASAWIDADVAVGTHLADQLLLPFALAGAGSFTTLVPSDHARTNAALIEKFLPVEIAFEPQQGKAWLVRVEG